MKQNLGVLIRSAFAGVTLGDGVGLYEARELDRMSSKEEQALARERDERLDWNRINRADLLRCLFAFYSLDDKGLRFCLPAMMLAELNDSGFFYGELIARDTVKNRYALLNRAQKESVREFLLWCVHSERSGRQAIIEALNGEFWISKGQR